jgi:type II secretory pathway component GspD/PulD (secretin)
MRFAILTLLLIASLAAQTATETKTFDFANKPSATGLKDVTTILRVVGRLVDVSADTATSAVKVTGTPDELAMSAWIIRNLDQPSPSPDPYLVAGKSDDGIRMFHLSRAAAESPQAVQEMITVIRTVGDIQKVFVYTDHSDLVVRGTATELGLVQFLIGSLDQTKDPQRTAIAMTPEYHYSWAYASKASGTDTVRVYYLAHSSQPQQIQEILTNLRTVLDVQKVFNFTPLQALVLRGSPETVTASEWMIRSLDLPADAKASTQEFTASPSMPGGSSLQALYPANLKGPALMQTLTAVRSNVGIQKAFLKTSPATLVMRGSADQITKADQIIQTADAAAKP